tara:strand:- start:961 stop:1173 length:213 start_codon:yes stop_codon:yes gene_type:complete
MAGPIKMDVNPKGPNDLEQIIEVQKRKIEFLQGVCRRAGREIKLLKQLRKEEVEMPDEDLDYWEELRGKL